MFVRYQASDDEHLPGEGDNEESDQLSLEEVGAA